MITLALDCAQSGLSVAILRDDQILASVVETGDRLQSTALLHKIQDVLTQSEQKLSDISQVIYGNGPGSFTSLRIGLATLQGLFLKLPRPEGEPRPPSGGRAGVRGEPIFLTCSSLLLRCVALQKSNEDISCFIQAGRDRVYFGELKNGVFAEKVLPVEELAASQAVTAPDPVNVEAFLKIQKLPSLIHTQNISDAQINYLLSPDIG